MRTSGVWAAARKTNSAKRKLKPRPRERRTKSFMSDIAIIGAGAWGTAISIVLGRKGTHRLRLWAYEKEVCESIQSSRSNVLFLPGQRVPESVRVTSDLASALQKAEVFVSALPSNTGSTIFTQLPPNLNNGIPFSPPTQP